jgi:hypothetical protein
MARSDPSYGPIARLRAIGEGRLRQRGQVPVSMLITRHDGSGSPQRVQSGGTNVLIVVQQVSQTAPRVG